MLSRENTQCPMVLRTHPITGQHARGGVRASLMSEDYATVACDAGPCEAVFVAWG